MAGSCRMLDASGKIDLQYSFEHVPDLRQYTVGEHNFKVEC